jgi:hypothetical protein
MSWLKMIGFTLLSFITAVANAEFSIAPPLSLLESLVLGRWR